jgi:hypothetical protein
MEKKEWLKKHGRTLCAVAILILFGISVGCATTEIPTDRPYRIIDTTVEGYDGPQYAWWRFWDDAIYIEDKQ